jgi:hypothetical protein
LQRQVAILKFLALLCHVVDYADRARLPKRTET